MQSEQQDSILQGHLPECECYGRSHGKCALCICDRLRACEERVRQGMESLAHLYEQDAYMRGWSEALDAARQAVATTGGRMWIGKAETLAAIDALLTTENPPLSPAKAKPADLHDPQMGEMIHGDR